MAVKFCERCKKPFQEGYVLYDTYAYCDEVCLKTDNFNNRDIIGKTMDELFENDIQYYTSWKDVAPYYDLTKVFVVFDTIFFQHKNAQKVAEEHRASKEQVKHRWLLIPQDDMDSLTNDNGLSDTQYNLFNSLQAARTFYNELEELEAKQTAQKMAQLFKNSEDNGLEY